MGYNLGNAKSSKKKNADLYEIYNLAYRFYQKLPSKITYRYIKKLNPKAAEQMRKKKDFDYSMDKKILFSSLNALVIYLGGYALLFLVMYLAKTVGRLL